MGHEEMIQNLIKQSNLYEGIMDTFNWQSTEPIDFNFINVSNIEERSIAENQYKVISKKIQSVYYIKGLDSSNILYVGQGWVYDRIDCHYRTSLGVIYYNWSKNLKRITNKRQMKFFTTFPQKVKVYWINEPIIYKDQRNFIEYTLIMYLNPLFNQLGKQGWFADCK